MIQETEQQPEEPNREEPSREELDQALRSFSAERYYKNALAAQGRGEMRAAIQAFDTACKLDPNNPIYTQALANARAQGRAVAGAEKARVQSQSASAAPPVKASVPRGQLVALVASLAFAAAAVAWAWPKDTSPPDLSLQYADVADFLRLKQADDGTWVASVNELWDGASSDARQRRCDAISEGLPPSAAPTILIRSADGVSFICRRD